MAENCLVAAERHMAGISAECLCKRYGHFSVLENISFSLPPGKSLSVIGKSGCGKSTLLSILARLQPCTGGTVRFTAENGLSFFDTYKRMPRLSYVLQEYGLFPWKTAYENLALPLQIVNCGKAEIREKVTALLEELNLQETAKRYPCELSGGQKQRLALGRALISKPEIILLDEPFSSVDAINREYLQNLILSLWKKYRFTFVLVTHSVSEAVYLGSGILSLAKFAENRPVQQTYFENPFFAEDDMREHKEFFELCKTVQHSLSDGYE